MNVAWVLPDVPAIDRTFDYSVPDSFGDRVRVGTMVRIPLGGRRVGGWVVATDVDPPPDTKLSAVAKVSSLGPDAEMIDLCRWVAWRYAGRLATILRQASPDRVVAAPPPIQPRPADSERPLKYGPGTHLLTVAPTTDPTDLAIAAATLGQALIVTPTVAGADRLAKGLRGAGARVARWPNEFAAAAGGATIVGGRGAVFAPAPALAAIVVIDEHDEGLQNESSPTWHAREIAIERARRAHVPCVLVSPCPSLEARAAAPPIRPNRSVERAGWAPITVIDRRTDESARSGLFTSPLVEAVREVARSDRRVLCVLNRTGRARLLACRQCGTIAECDRCAAAVHLTDVIDLACDRCGQRRPAICLECGSTGMSVLRLGVSRAREELEALALEPVELVTAATPAAAGSARIQIGTEAVLHRSHDAGLVAFLDIDQELLAPRYRASEEAMALLMLGSRLVGGRDHGGRLLVQTRLPGHEVLRAVAHADPSIVSDAERERRDLLGFPPSTTLALIGGEAGPAYVDRFGHPAGVAVLGPDDGRWLLRSTDRSRLLDRLSEVERPPGRLRLQVDPVRFR